MQNPLADRSPPPSRRHFQFSLRTLFIISFLLAIFFAGIFSKYDAVRLQTMILWIIIYSSFLIGLAIYGKGYGKTFAIGGLAAFTILLLPGFIVFTTVFENAIRDISLDMLVDFSEVTTVETDLESLLMPAILVFSTFLMSAIAGVTVVVTRWFVERSMRQRENTTLQSASTNLATNVNIPQRQEVSL